MTTLLSHQRLMLYLALASISLLLPLTLRTAAFTPQASQITQLVANDGAPGDLFGYAVGIGGDTVVVGAYRDDVGSNAGQGSVYVYGRHQGGVDNWGQVTKLTASDGAAGDQFGLSVAISGDTVVVGAWGADGDGNSNQGAAYIFERNQGGTNNWGQVAKLTASDGADSDLFGYAVGISGDTVIVGAWGDNVGARTDQGSAYLFERHQGGVDNWGQVTQLVAGDGVASDAFGAAVGISGDTVVVGAYQDDRSINTNQGSAYVYARDQGGAGNWGQVTHLSASDGAASDAFGAAVGISGDTVVVGAYQDDRGTNSNQGSAYIFGRDQGGADTWGQVAQLSASDGAASDNFGLSVAIHSDTVLVGAWNDDVSGQVDQGSAYMYARDQGGIDSWGQVTRLAASDGAPGDNFGSSVGLDGGLGVVGAWFDTVGGNISQGSAYLYDLASDPAATPTPTARTSATRTPTATRTLTVAATPTSTSTPTSTVTAGSGRLYLPLLRRSDPMRGR